MTQIKNRVIRITHISSLATCEYLISKKDERTPDELLILWLTKDKYYHIHKDANRLMITEDKIHYILPSWVFNIPIKKNKNQFMAEEIE